MNEKNRYGPLVQRQFSDYNRMTEQKTLKEDKKRKKESNF